MIAIGYQGPVLLEDAYDLAMIAVKTGRGIPATEWVEEFRGGADGVPRGFAAFGI